MDRTSLTTALSKFIQQVTQVCGGQDRPLTVNDLRLGIRNARMSEISDWSDHLLDFIEVHAAQFGDNVPLECVLELPAEGDHSAYAVSVSSICSPSAFAWT